MNIFRLCTFFDNSNYLEIVSGLDDLIHIKRGGVSALWKGNLSIISNTFTYSFNRGAVSLRSILWISCIDSIWNIDKVKILIPNRRVTGVTAVFLAAVSVFVQTSSNLWSKNIQTSLLVAFSCKLEILKSTYLQAFSCSNYLKAYVMFRTWCLRKLISGLRLQWYCASPSPSWSWPRPTVTGRTLPFHFHFCTFKKAQQN